MVGVGVVGVEFDGPVVGGEGLFVLVEFEESVAFVEPVAGAELFVVGDGGVVDWCWWWCG